MYSNIYKMNIFKDEGLIRFELDMKLKTVNILRQYVTEEFERRNWRTVVDYWARDQLILHIAPEQINMIEQVLWNPPPVKSAGE